MTALAGIHRVPWEPLTYLGAPVPFEEDVARWDPLFERAADPEALERAPEVRKALLERIPEAAPIGVFHGDFQTANLFCDFDGHLKAVIDFELTGIGATLNDLGWICTFSDRAAWADGSERTFFLEPETLIGYYEGRLGRAVADLAWYRALAAYKFALITGFNLMLHRRGKRDDPLGSDAPFHDPTY